MQVDGPGADVRSAGQHHHGSQDKPGAHYCGGQFRARSGQMRTKARQSSLPPGTSSRLALARHDARCNAHRPELAAANLVAPRAPPRPRHSLFFPGFAAAHSPTSLSASIRPVHLRAAEGLVCNGVARFYQGNAADGATIIDRFLRAVENRRLRFAGAISSERAHTSWLLTNGRLTIVSGGPVLRPKCSIAPRAQHESRS